MISISLCFLQQQLDPKVLNLTASWGDPINHMFFFWFSTKKCHTEVANQLLRSGFCVQQSWLFFWKPDPDNWFATSAWRCFCWKPKESFTACSIVSQIPMIWDPTAWQSGEHALEAPEYTWTYSRSQSWPWWHLVACVLLPAARCLLPTACWLLPLPPRGRHTLLMCCCPLPAAAASCLLPKSLTWPVHPNDF